MHTTSTVSSNGLFEMLFMYKTNILPRQARDKHRASTPKKDYRFSSGTLRSVTDCELLLSYSVVLTELDRVAEAR